MLISLDVPKFVKTNDKSGTENTMRRWYIVRLSCPKLSIFDSLNACVANSGMTKNAGGSGLGGSSFQGAIQTLHERVTAQQVLNFPLSNGRTIRQHLSDQEWFVHFLREAGSVSDKGSATTEEGGSAKRNDDDYGVLCVAIVDSLYSVGLSSLDARIGLWATVTGSADFVGIRSKFADKEGCKGLIPTPQWSY